METLHDRALQLSDLLLNPRHFSWLAPLLMLVDGTLTSFTVRAIPYTEIDWVAYMQQIKIYRSGERDYAKIEGQTGPLVYPAGHVLIYDLLYRLTDDGSNILRAQCIFVFVYLTALYVVMACYREAKAPPYLLGLLVLSKRLHSIFVLRLFNDCFAVLGLFSAIYFIQTGMFLFGSLAFSLAVSIKMSMLLAAPGVGMVLLQALPTKRAANMAMIMLQVQVLLAIPFISVNARSYLMKAFEITRQFLFKWTVNWRFVGEETFLSGSFAVSLLVANIILLLLFTYTRWTRPSGLDPWTLAKTICYPVPAKAQRAIASHVTADFIMTAILTSLVSGLLCARSLHYQFFAYLAWSTPFLLWKSGLPPYLIVAIWAVQEVAWNVYPSTSASSVVVVGCLALQVLGVWFGTRKDNAATRDPFAAEEDKLDWD